MEKKQIGNCTLYLGKMENTIHQIHGVNHILTDPPYLYIKTHDFDREWDEQLFFENAKRLLPDDGFIALFGRGTSFYRWNTRLADLGFVFKEEIVWDKRYTTAPCIALSRVHETISLHTKKTGKIRRSKVPYTEQKQNNIQSIIDDIKKIKSAINTEAGLNKVLAFLQGGELYELEAVDKHCISQQPGIKKPDRASAVINSIKNGMNEKSILTLAGSHYNNAHPTEKPVRLAERILALISDPGDTIYDHFMGSGSFGVACINTGRKYIGSEMKPEYFAIACKRMKEATEQAGLFAEAI
ncbi:MAG: site-specific DNA-methyltransferase [Treponema sp.]|jgi:site-specific DNA-methyltransferase (adenine-specific)|nr:site-specific DNA-methyltransferase [Treponema sp.]